MCWTSVPDYKRTDVPKVNRDIIRQVRDNFDSSYSYEEDRLPDQSHLRFEVPKQIRDDLELGGNLRADTQDQIVQAALNGTNASGVINSFNGRGQVAKDIGQQAEGIRQARLGRAQDYMAQNPMDYLGLTSGQMGSIYVDDKVRDFQNQKDKVQAQQADTATNIAIGLGVLNALI
jgi:hypothetical protein